MLPLIFRDGVIKNNKIYTFGLFDTVLCSIDTIKKKVQIEDFLFDKECGAIVIDLMLAYMNDLFAISADGKYIVRYSMESHVFKIIKTDYSDKADSNFCGIARIENEVYIFTRNRGMAIVYDVVDDSIRYVDYPAENDEYSTLINCSDGIWLIPRNGNRILKLCIKTLQWETIMLQESFQECVHAVLDGNSFFFLQSNGLVIEWNYFKNCVSKNSLAVGLFDEYQTASRLCVLNDKMIILPGQADNIVILEKGQLQARVYKDYPKDFKYDATKKLWAKYVHYTDCEDAVFFSCRTSEYILKIDRISQQICWIKCLLSDSERMKYRIEKEEKIYEQGDDLLYYIMSVKKWN